MSVFELASLTLAPSSSAKVLVTIRLSQVEKIISPELRLGFPSLYSNIAKCYEDLGDLDNAKKNYELAMSFMDKPSDNGLRYERVGLPGNFLSVTQS